MYTLHLDTITTEVIFSSALKAIFATRVEFDSKCSLNVHIFQWSVALCKWIGVSEDESTVTCCPWVASCTLMFAWFFSSICNWDHFCSPQKCELWGEWGGHFFYENWRHSDRKKIVSASCAPACDNMCGQLHRNERGLVRNGGKKIKVYRDNIYSTH